MTASDAQSEFFRKAVTFRDARPVISTSAYASGDVLGGKLTLTDVVNANGLGGFIHSVTVIDQSKQKSRLDLLIFGADPAASAFVDNAALAVGAADQPNIIGAIPITAADYLDVGAIAVATVRGVGLAFDLLAGRALFAVAMCGGAPTYTGTDDLIFRIGIAQG